MRLGGGGRGVRRMCTPLRTRSMLPRSAEPGTLSLKPRLTSAEAVPHLTCELSAAPGAALDSVRRRAS